LTNSCTDEALRAETGRGSGLQLKTWGEVITLDEAKKLIDQALQELEEIIEWAAKYPVRG